MPTLLDGKNQADLRVGFYAIQEYPHMTGIFRCVKCDHIDHMDIVYPVGAEMDVDLRPLPLFCTVCHDRPWHNRMIREKYNPELHDVVNPPPGILAMVAG